SEAPFMAQEEIAAVIEETVSDCPEEILSELAEQLVRYQFYLNIIGADETQVQITKHILKTVCTDVTNILVNFLAADLMMSAENPSTITNEVRVKILGKLSEETKGPLMKLHNCLNGKFLHRQALTEQLKVVEDPALVLHLTSVLLFQASTHCMLHAPGRCVPQIIGTLTGRIPTEQQQLLSAYQGLVVKQLVSQNQGRKQEEAEGDEAVELDEEARNVRSQLLLLTPQVKELVLSQRKTSVNED
ncbi:hypothetical protein GOODEAATRI_019025, partial [Goodea atripinnis]